MRAVSGASAAVTDVAMVAAVVAAVVSVVVSVVVAVVIVAAGVAALHVFCKATARFCSFRNTTRILHALSTKW